MLCELRRRCAGVEYVRIRVRWLAVAAGAVTTLGLIWTYAFLVERIIPAVMLVLSDGNSEGRVEVPTFPFYLVGVLFLLIAHSLGGALAGRMAWDSPGLNGALSTVLAAFAGVARFLYAALPTILGSDTEAFARSEDMGLHLFAVASFVVFFPLTLSMAYFGGLLGGRRRG